MGIRSQVPYKSMLKSWGPERLTSYYYCDLRFFHICLVLLLYEFTREKRYVLFLQMKALL